MPVTGPGNGPAGLSPSKRGAPTGGTSRRKLDRKAPAPRVPAKAKAAVDKLLDEVRAKADQRPAAAKEETDRGEEKRDASGLFTKGTKPGPGRPPGSPNKIPKSIKQVVRDLCEGVIEVTSKDPATDKLVQGPVAHLLAERLVAGLNDPKHYPAFVKMLLEYGIGRPKTQTDVGSEDRRQIPKMIFLHEPYDPMAKPGDPSKPLRILGQIAGPNGEIIEARTGKVVVPAPGQTVPVNDGLGEGEDRLELVEDLPLPCPACGGGGRQRTGFGDRTEACDDCAGTGTMQ
jgi:hypothetical protein